MDERRVLVLVSGGLDSTVLVEMLGSRPEGLPSHLMRTTCMSLHGLIFFDYGQPAVVQERVHARTVSERAGVNLELQELRLATQGTMAIDAGAPSARVVPHRNLMMLAHALNYAVRIDATDVWYGACKDDWADYPDCRPTFISGLNTALAASWPGPSRTIGRPSSAPWVSAPLSHMTKTEIVGIARTLGIDRGTTWSCYTPVRNEPCGTCNSCVAMHEAGP